MRNLEAEEYSQWPPSLAKYNNDNSIILHEYYYLGAFTSPYPGCPHSTRLGRCDTVIPVLWRCNLNLTEIKLIQGHRLKEPGLSAS